MLTHLIQFLQVEEDLQCTANLGLTLTLHAINQERLCLIMDLSRCLLQEGLVRFCCCQPHKLCLPADRTDVCQQLRSFSQIQQLWRGRQLLPQLLNLMISTAREDTQSA